MRRRGPKLPPRRVVLVHAAGKEQGAREHRCCLLGSEGETEGENGLISAYLSISLPWKMLVGRASSNAPAQLHIPVHRAEFQLVIAIKFSRRCELLRQIRE